MHEPFKPPVARYACHVLVGLALALPPRLAAGDVSLSTGAFTHAIPIEVPAYHGLEPKLALAYSSQGGNGFVGVGWSLAGASTIERLAGTGRSFLDGQELVPCPAGSASPSCTTGGTHSTKIESYLRIRFDAAANTWTVWGNDGTRTTFTRIIDAGGTTVRWGQANAVDTYGNTVTYGWACPDGDCYPDTITYNGYSVTLFREARPDVLTFSQGGVLGATRHRLRSVIVQLGASPIRGYKLGYTTSPDTGRSLLASVQQFGRDLTHNAGAITAGTALPAQTFSYSVDPAAHALNVRPVNRPPLASVSHTGACAGGNCTALFSASTSDGDGDPVALAWSGCAAGTDSSLSCARSGAGALTATVTLDDGRGGSAVVADTATVYATAYATGAWGACAGSQAWSCTSAGPAGCSRPGIQMRSVTETDWAWDSDPGVPAPASTQSCVENAPAYVVTYSATYSAWNCTATGPGGCSRQRQAYSPSTYGPTSPDAPVPPAVEYTPGYVATYSATYEANWTCTASGATGCRKNRLSYGVASHGPTAPDAPVPAATIYTTGYVASWWVGPWEACSVSCGGGWQRRSYGPASWKATAPDAAAPAESQPCNYHACTYTCYDYGLYNTWSECYGAGWSYCDTRYKNDGTGNLLTCRHGYN